MILTELLKALLYGIVEGITEWLPISSTGHLILLGEICPLAVSEGFSETFDVVIQLGAILSVVVLYFRKLNPISPAKTPALRRETWGLWGRVLAAVIPSAVAGFLLDDLLTRYLYGSLTVAVTLILYGILFILVERRRPGAQAPVTNTAELPVGTALGIGCFQILSLIPGTSRSGATILGGMLLGVSRGAAAEFSFFLAIPTMLGAGGLKVCKLMAAGVSLTPTEWGILAVGCLSAFLVSMAAIRFLMDFVRRHSFSAFGWYRIGLGLAVLIAFYR
jgi:undecaprenyl-diphosphatase